MFYQINKCFNQKKFTSVFLYVFKEIKKPQKKRVDTEGQEPVVERKEKRNQKKKLKKKTNFPSNNK